MKKMLYMLTAVFASFFLLIAHKHVSATVGGPTLISEPAFKASENALYYKVNDHGGRGCPPLIHKVDLATLKDTEVKSCTQVEQEFLSGNYEAGMQKYNEFLSTTYQDLSYVGSVSLQKNNIDVQVAFISEHLDEFNFPMWSEFNATITQDNKKISTITFRGCSKDQPHVFEGYMIPNSDVMALLISNKGDCFEGGYVGEVLHVIKGVRYSDTAVVRSFKGDASSEPNLANIVVTAEERNVQEVKNNQPLFVVGGVVLFGVGAALGYLFGRKKS